MDQQRIGRGFLGTLLFAALAVAATCGGAQAETIVRIGGTGSGLPAMRLLATAYSKTHPDVSIKVVPSLGSGGGIAALAKGALDLAISARPLKDTELSLGARAVEYARTPLVFAVHKDVPKTNLTSDEVLAIYAGKTRTWSDGTRIRLILRPMSDSGYPDPEAAFAGVGFGRAPRARAPRNDRRRHQSGIQQCPRQEARRSGGFHTDRDRGGEAGG